MSKRPNIAISLISFTLAAGCVYPAAQTGHGGSLIITPRFSMGTYTQEVINPYTQADIAHLQVKLSVIATSEIDTGIGQDLTNAQLSNPIVFSNLKANTTYRIRAYAYNAAGTGIANLISTTASDSYTDVVILDNDRPTLTTLKVKLVDRTFNGQATSNLTITPGIYTPTGSESATFGNLLKGIVTTFVGNANPGYANSSGSSAYFNGLDGLGMDAAGNLYVADQNNNLVRKITPAGVASTFAGGGGGTLAGFADGVGTAAKFNGLAGLAVNTTTGEIYVSEIYNCTIRKITSAGVVTTVAGRGTYGFADGTGTNAYLSYPFGLTLDSSGNLYIADLNNNRIRKMTPAGVVTTLAGDTPYAHADGYGTNAKLHQPIALSFDNRGNLYFVEYGGFLVRKLAPNSYVSTIAGDYQATGSADGQGTTARFKAPMGIVCDANGNIYIGDTSNSKIRKIDPSGMVSTLAGNGTWSLADGTGTTAIMANPGQVFLAPDGSLYFTDGHRIRKVQ